MSDEHDDDLEPDEPDEVDRPALEYPNDLARRVARGLGLSTHREPRRDVPPS